MDTRVHLNKTKPQPLSKVDNDNSTLINSRRKFPRRGTNDLNDQEEIDLENEDMSDSSEHELDALDSDDDLDAETGLPTEERRKFLRRQRRENTLEARIAGVSGRLSKDEGKEADKSVIRELAFNVVLIGLWYFFSLSISLVNISSMLVKTKTNSPNSTTSGCFHPTTSTFIFLSSLPRFTWSFSSSFRVLCSFSYPPFVQRPDHKMAMRLQDKRNHYSHPCSTLPASYPAVQQPPSTLDLAMPLFKQLHSHSIRCANPPS